MKVFDVAAELTRKISNEFEPARRVIDLVGFEVPIPDAVVCALGDQAQQAAARGIFAVPGSGGAVGQGVHGNTTGLRLSGSETGRAPRLGSAAAKTMLAAKAGYAG